MPVRKCSNGKYRIGSGQCMYKSHASAERAYKGYLGSKYMNKVDEKMTDKNLNEKVNLMAAEIEDDELHAKDIKRIMKLAGVEKGIQDGENDKIDFTGTLNKSSVSEMKYSLLRMLESQLQHTENDGIMSIGDEVETPLGHGFIIDVSITSGHEVTYTVQHPAMRSEVEVDTYELPASDVQKIDEKVNPNQTIYFSLDPVGQQVVSKSPMNSEIKYQDGNIMGITSDRYDELYSMVVNAGGTISQQDTGLDETDPYSNEPSEREIDQGMEYIDQYIAEYIDTDEYAIAVLQDLKSGDLDQEDIDGLVSDLISDTTGYVMSQLAQNDMEFFDKEQVKDIIKTRFKNNGIINDGMDLSEGSYNRLIVGMILDGMKYGKTVTQIAEDLSFDESSVRIIYEEIVKLKKH